MDFSRPTKRGMTICGYTTTSRSGRTGRPWMETDLVVDADSVTRRALNTPEQLQMQRTVAVFSQSVAREMGMREDVSTLATQFPIRSRTAETCRRGCTGKR